MTRTVPSQPEEEHDAGGGARPDACLEQELTLPLSEAQTRSLCAGDSVRLTGTLFTARDAVHKYLAAGGTAPCPLSATVVYHCGPVVRWVGDCWQVLAAGPTTSMREEPYLPGLIARYGLRGVIGKGGMGPATLAACRKYGCVYFQAVGGAAQLLAACVQRVGNVHLLDRFGPAEAIWELEVRGFPALLTMDTHGTSLHVRIAERARTRLDALRQPPGEPARAAAAPE